jgi:predicted RNase H-like HicB family nuclease
MPLRGAVTTTDVVSNFDDFIDAVVGGKPQAVRRDRDIIIALSLDQMRELLTAYPLNYEYEVDEDRRCAGSICEIELIVADGATVEELRLNLANQLSEYAKDYMNDFSRYFSAPNTRPHFPYVLRVLLEDDIEAVASTLRSVAEDSGETGSSGNSSLGCVVDYVEKNKARHFGKVIEDNNVIWKDKN